MGDVGRYRDKAAEMRVRAHTAASADLAAMYRELARHWDALAERKDAYDPESAPRPDDDKWQA